MRRRILLWTIGLLGLIFLAIQFVPVEMENPPVTLDLAAPDEVDAVLRRACYDCHSHETVWPWYSGVAPVSWLLASDVEEGREHMNFSEWAVPTDEEDDDDESEDEIIAEMLEQIEEGEMPPRLYLWLHAEARLSPEDRSLLRRWAAARAASGTTGSDPE